MNMVNYRDSKGMVRQWMVGDYVKVMQGGNHRKIHAHCDKITEIVRTENGVTLKTRDGRNFDVRGTCGNLSLELDF